ncbi:hypothetical protein HZB78_05455 [Candidatus Collierbacteria bacterium]|nr:hypothetical protein [Candidatus Collierbacteria bacterium]
MKQKQRATLAQIFRLQEWFSIPGELLEKLTLAEAGELIARVYRSRLTPVEMSDFKGQLLAMIKKREPEAF